MFGKYAHAVLEKLILGELWVMTDGNRVTYNFFDRIASKMELALLYVLARDDEGFLSKEVVICYLDGMSTTTSERG